MTARVARQGKVPGGVRRAVPGDRPRGRRSRQSAAEEKAEAGCGTPSHGEASGNDRTAIGASPRNGRSSGVPAPASRAWIGRGAGVPKSGRATPRSHRAPTRPVLRTAGDRPPLSRAPRRRKRDSRRGRCTPSRSEADVTRVVQQPLTGLRVGGRGGRRPHASPKPGGLTGTGAKSLIAAGTRLRCEPNAPSSDPSRQGGDSYLPHDRAQPRLFTGRATLHCPAPTDNASAVDRLAATEHPSGPHLTRCPTSS